MATARLSTLARLAPTAAPVARLMVSLSANTEIVFFFRLSLYVSLVVVVVTYR